jgi:hypothetical protein
MRYHELYIIQVLIFINQTKCGRYKLLLPTLMINNYYCISQFKDHVTFPAIESVSYAFRNRSQQNETGRTLKPFLSQV